MRLSWLWLCLPALAQADGSEVVRAALTPRCALEADIRRDEQPACWRLDCVDQSPRELGCDLTAMHQVAGLSPDASGEWLAVLSVGEGHPFVEVVPLAPWLDQGRYLAQCTINPYPGTIDVESWNGGSLWLSSDVDLQQAEGERSLPETDWLRYALRPQDCALTRR